MAYKTFNKYVKGNPLDDAVMTSEDIDKVILVGGPTRIPMVQEYVELYLDKEVERGIDSMECMAQGAAIQAGVIDGVIGDLILVDVTPLSFGTEVADDSTSVIIPRNTAILVRKSETYSTVQDNQTGVNVRVIQGE